MKIDLSGRLNCSIIIKNMCIMSDACGAVKTTIPILLVKVNMANLLKIK